MSTPHPFLYNLSQILFVSLLVSPLLFSLDKQQFLIFLNYKINGPGTILGKQCTSLLLDFLSFFFCHFDVNRHRFCFVLLFCSTKMGKLRQGRKAASRCHPGCVALYPEPLLSWSKGPGAGRPAENKRSTSLRQITGREDRAPA